MWWDVVVVLDLGPGASGIWQVAQGVDCSTWERWMVVKMHVSEIVYRMGECFVRVICS